jgi:NAD(P)H-dependent FMN reductase
MGQKEASEARATREEGMRMGRVVGIPGSLRKGSFNSALLRAAAETAPAGLSIEVASIGGIPLYDGDLEEEQGSPAAVSELKELVAASDGLIIATPEYNGSMPGVLKNALDWLSRPPNDSGRVFGGKALGLMGATPGGGGTALAQASWLPVFRALRLRLWTGGALQVSRAFEVFDEKGNLTDGKIRDRLEKFMAGFAGFVEMGKGGSGGS